jgi:RNA-binding protein
MSLTTKQKSYLKALAHHLSPIVRIGHGGLTDGVVAETDRSIEAHELVKVQIETDDRPNRKALAEQLAARVGAEVVGSVGKIAMLYRARKEKPAIHLPA